MAARRGSGSRGLRAAVVAVCRRLDARGLVAGAEGNVSVRVGQEFVLVTPSGMRKGELRSADLVDVSLVTGTVRGAGTASSEVAMHLAIYRQRPDLRAIVHAHPPVATGFAAARRPIPVSALAELAGVIGPVPLVRYYPPGSQALANAVAAALVSADVALLSNHGAVTAGLTPDHALNLMESLEQAARILVTAHILGGVIELDRDEVVELEQGRRRSLQRGANDSGKRDHARD